MRNIGKYLLSATVAIVMSLTVAKISAQACSLVVEDEYTCYVTGSDETYCYYDCYCKTSTEKCYAALERDGFEEY